MAAASALGLCPVAGLVVAVVFLSAAWVSYVRRKGRAALVLVLLAVAATGAARTSQHDRAHDSNTLHTYQTDGYLDVEGTLLRSPEREPDRDTLFIRIDAVRDEGRAHALRGNLRLSVPFARGIRPRLALHAGERISASVRLATGGSFHNFGGFSYDRYLKAQNVHRRASTKTALLVVRKAKGQGLHGSLRRAVSRVRCTIQAGLERRFPAADGHDIGPEGAVLEALLLGEDGRLDPATVSNLQESGLFHLFAISGGHIAIVTLLLFSLFRLARMSDRASRAALIVFLLFYTLLVEGRPSVLRATIMTLFFLVGKLLWKDVQALNTIAASAFVLLLANPASLHDLGFQLTYGATLAIIVFYPPLFRRLPRLPLRASEMTALSVSALLGVLPLVARNFNRVTFASLVLNFAAVPLVGVVMGLGYATLPLAAALPQSAGLTDAALKFLVRIFSWLSHLLDPLFLLSYRVPTPRAWTLAGYFLFLGLALARPRFRRQRALVLTAFGLFFLLLILHPFPLSSPDLKVTMIDVGQGESFLVEFPGRRKMLIDGGGFVGSSFDVGERVVSPFLWSKSIRRIDILVLTHPHPDHLGGLPAVARNFRVREFWEASPAPEDEGYRGLIEALPGSVTRKQVSRGFRHREGQAVIEALHPGRAGEAGAGPAANESSLVLRIALGEVSFLFTGDIGAATEKGILGTGEDLRSTVLKAPHHGSAYSSSAAFLEAVGPRIVLVSAGQGNTYGFPSPAALDRWEEAGAHIFRTDVDGAVEVRTDGREVRVRTARRGPPPRRLPIDTRD
jgi:competence protein ComEC